MVKRIVVKIYRALGVESTAHMKVRIRRSINHQAVRGVKSVWIIEGNRHDTHGL